jgi:hypothetical protein
MLAHSCSKRYREGRKEGKKGKWGEGVEYASSIKKHTVPETLAKW